MAARMFSVDEVIGMVGEEPELDEFITPGSDDEFIRYNTIKCIT